MDTILSGIQEGMMFVPDSIKQFDFFGGVLSGWHLGLLKAAHLPQISTQFLALI